MDFDVNTSECADTPVEGQLAGIKDAISKVGSRIPTKDELAEIANRIDAQTTNLNSGGNLELFLLWIAFGAFLLIFYLLLRRTKTEDRFTRICRRVTVGSGAVVAVAGAITAIVKAGVADFELRTSVIDDDHQRIITVLPAETSGNAHPTIIVIENQAEIVPGSDESIATFIIPFEETGCMTTSPGNDWGGIQSIPEYAKFLVDPANCAFARGTRIKFSP